jgi:hypothetical protein
MSDDLQARLDALPEWPEPCSNAVRLGEISSDCSNCFDVAQETADAALARLALWHELAQAGDVRLVRHADDCCILVYPLRNPPRCTCGRDALLKAMEVPRG